MIGNLSKKQNHIYYLRSKVVKRLSGLRYLRLGIYSKGVLLETVGFLDTNNDFWFIKYSSLFSYVLRGLNFLNWVTRTKIVREMQFSEVVFISFYQWLMSSGVTHYLVRKVEWKKLLVKYSRIFWRFFAGYNVGKSFKFFIRRRIILNFKN